MQQSILRDLAVLLGIFGLIWLGASLFSFYPENPQLLSIDKEQKLGEAYVDLVLMNPMFRKLENEMIDSSIQVIADRLTGSLVQSEFDYRFIVIDHEMINALTVPGGNILISAGLIDFCESPEELAAVIAHEMGHVEKRHVVTRLIKELGIEILTPGDPYVMGEVTGMLTSTRFDRKQEEEADLFACRLLEDSNIEPRKLASLFRRLEEERGNALVEQFEIISTHPNLNSRIREVLTYLPKDGFAEKPIDLDWEKIKSGL